MTAPTSAGSHGRDPTATALDEALPAEPRSARAHTALLLGAGGLLAGVVATVLVTGQLPASPVLALLLASALPGAAAASPTMTRHLGARSHARLVRAALPLQLALLLGAVGAHPQGAASPLVLLPLLPLLPVAWSMSSRQVCALGGVAVTGLAVLAHTGDALTPITFTAAAVLALVTATGAVIAHAEQRRRAAQAARDARLMGLAHRDGLTGCLNHRAFQERLAEEVDRAQRYKRDLALMLLDLDDFKGLNDTYGHPAGDRALRAVGSLLTDLGRSADVAGRLGGDEFALLLPETSIEDAAVAAARLRARVDELRDPEPMTVSIGISALPELARDADELLRQADDALYHAKDDGSGRIRRFDAGIAETVDVTEPSGAPGANGSDCVLARRVADVVTNDKLFAEVQPVVRLTDGALVAYEAIGRVRDSSLPLHRWLELAEHCGLRPELEAAWWTVVASHGRPPSGVRLFVELSEQASTKALREALGRPTLGAPRRPAHATAGSYRTATRSLAAWAEATTTLSVEEALATYSTSADAIDRLRGLEPRWLKLPASLVARCDQQPGRMALIAALRGFADRAGGSLIAEGVTRQAEFQALRVAGICYAQGELFGAPAPPWPAAGQPDRGLQPAHRS